MNKLRRKKGKPQLKDKGHMKLVRPAADAQGHKGTETLSDPPRYHPSAAVH